jgi:hypothetical protein
VSENTVQGLKWISGSLFLMAGLLLSLNVDVSKIGFLLFFVGHVGLIVAFIKANDTPMIVQNSCFTVIDVIGIYRWFIL